MAIPSVAPDVLGELYEGGDPHPHQPLCRKRAVRHEHMRDVPQTADALDCAQNARISRGGCDDAQHFFI